MIAKSFDEERAETIKWADSLAESICESDDIKELIYHFILKRRFDGMNGREWDASEHLRHEKAVAQIINGYTNSESDHT